MDTNTTTAAHVRRFDCTLGALDFAVIRQLGGEARAFGRRFLAAIRREAVWLYAGKGVRHV